MSFDKGPRDDRWYFSIMAPNTKGKKFAWLDPTSMAAPIMIYLMTFAQR